MITYWAEHAELPDRPASRVRLLVDDGRFSAVQTGVDPEAGDRRLSGVVLPGFANGHSHAFHRALRGRTQGASLDPGSGRGRTGTFWTWREQMYAMAARLDPERYFILARATYAEMALAGMTAVGEFHYLHHDRGGRRYASPHAMSDALVAAAAEAGVRLTLLDVCYLSGGLGAGGHLELDPVQRRFSDGDLDGWAERAADWTPPAGVVKGSAVHSVRAVPETALERFVALAPDGPLHVHLSEQPAENTAVQAFYGCSPTELLDRHGLLSERTTAAHATHLTRDDVARLGAARTTTCFCPTTERDLADGIGPARELAEAGCRLSLGSDQNAVIDMFSEMRGLEMHERLTTGRRGRFSPAELIAAATRDGCRSLGRADGGLLRENAPADFVVVDTGSVRTVGCRPDQVHYAATAADVTDVVVGGQPVVVDRCHRLGDVGRLLSEALAALGEHP